MDKLDYNISEHMKEILKEHQQNDVLASMSIEEYNNIYEDDNYSPKEEEVLQYHVSIWDKIETYGDFKLLMILFLRGILKHSIISLGPVFPETIPLLGNLIEINQLNFISLEGQPGECVEEFSHIALEDDLEAEIFNTTGIIQVFQRAYIDGIYPRDRMNDLINELTKNSVDQVLIQISDYKNNSSVFVGNTNFNIPENLDSLMNLLNQQKYDNKNMDDTIDLTIDKTLLVDDLSIKRQKKWREFMMKRAMLDDKEQNEFDLATRRDFNVDISKEDIVFNATSTLDFDTSDTNILCHLGLNPSVRQRILDNVYLVNIVRLERCKTDLDKILLMALEKIQ